MNTETTSSRPQANGSSHPQAPQSSGAEGAPGDSLVTDAVGLLDGVVEYLSAVFRLERYRFEVRTRSFVQKAMLLVTSAAVLLVGLVFVSVGVSSLLSEALQVPYAGPLIVGGVYTSAGLIALLVLARKKES